MLIVCVKYASTLPTLAKKLFGVTIKVTVYKVSQGFPIPLKMGLYYKSNQKEQTCNLHQLQAT